MWRDDIQRKAQLALLKQKEEEALDLQMKEYYQTISASGKPDPNLSRAQQLRLEEENRIIQ